MEQFLTTETLIIELLLIVSLVAIVVRRLRVPYTVALVVIGLLITFQQSIQISLTPELILALFVPPLVFEAAFHIDFDQLRDNLTLILALAVPGVLLTMLIVGLIVSAGVGLPLSTALVFGALIAATDPVAVVALFRTLGVPSKLALIVESESLFNDGTSIVVFNLALAGALQAAVAGAGHNAGFNLGIAITDFIRVSLGGIGIGLALGWLVSWLIAQLDDYLIETTLTTVLAFGSYLVADRLGLSGVLAVVCAGLVNGNVGSRGMSPTTRVVLFNFWEYLAFIANSLVFLLIGLDVNIPQIAANIGPIAIAVLAVVISRALTVYGLTWLTHLRRGLTVPLAYRHVLFWGGLRGAIGLALALSLPIALPQRDLLEVMAFGVVLFTLLAQGTTIQPILERLGLVERSPHVLDREARLGRLYAAQAGLRRLADLYHDGLLSRHVWAGLRDEYDRTSERLGDEMTELFAEHADLELEVLLEARREALRAERVALGDALRRGLISERVHRELTQEVDRRLEALTFISDEAAGSSVTAGE
jgi:CPA1 family monovalent cation:H+ antiporter